MNFHAGFVPFDGTRTERNANFMKTTIHTCDLCKQSKSENDLSKINVQTRGVTIFENKYAPAMEIDICKDCLKKKGFVVIPASSKEETEQNSKTNEKALRDKIMDILEDLDVAFHE